MPDFDHGRRNQPWHQPPANPDPHSRMLRSPTATNSHKAGLPVARIPVCGAAGHPVGRGPASWGGDCRRRHFTGLTLACSLAQLGVKAVLLDEDNTVGVKGASSRGICYTQKSLEIFDKLGIYRAHRTPRASSGAWGAPLPGKTRSIRSTCASRATSSSRTSPRSSTSSSSTSKAFWSSGLPS
jgi:hypothetical protein